MSGKKTVGIILAGGSGTRLNPLTLGVSKQLLAVYDKPMVYYPLSVLMLAGISDVLIITTPHDQASFIRVFGDGSNIGMNICYAVQEKPDGIAKAFIIGEQFIGENNVCLILGDNIFHGNGFTAQLRKCIETVSNEDKANVFGYWVHDPERYGVATFDSNGTCTSIEEKPEKPKSNYAVVGLYFYPNDVISIAKGIKPSARGELEITAVNQEYLKQGRLKLTPLGRGFAWLDTGTHESLSEASNYIETIEKRQGMKIACIEEIAYRNEWINKQKMYEIGLSMQNNQYGKYLISIASNLS